ncbi:hypothetical protein SAMN04488020_10413 [Palleronia marisminoris]|uniref:Uncharacterized protein n=1 Tax=Palleronia marisminoris TaxID=315423 RepID=A0A1Y5SJ77_9RHOB|nr:hypothetical protein SAMN04488020_10413 [Palleronia marisminoris]SLN38892.1 hypothetical protein PAM7066_01636 [Palleronia marisminoris]
MRRRGDRMRALGTRRPMLVPDTLDIRWSLDFVSEIHVRQHDYNHQRPRSGLGNIPPAEFVAPKGLTMRAA